MRTKKTFFTVNGYDETLSGYGLEDIDLYNRLEKLVYSKGCFNWKNIIQPFIIRMKSAFHMNIWECTLKKYICLT